MMLTAQPDKPCWMRCCALRCCLLLRASPTRPALVPCPRTPLQPSLGWRQHQAATTLCTEATTWRQVLSKPLINAMQCPVPQPPGWGNLPCVVWGRHTRSASIPRVNLAALESSWQSPLPVFFCCAITLALTAIAALC